MNGGELTARLMAAAGITHSFGIMVETLVPIVQEFHKRLGGRFIAVRHEQVGASAADAFARVSGRPAVCFGSVTAGATNLLTGVAIAYRDSVPLIIITGNDKRKYLYRDIWQGMDVVPIFRHLTKSAIRSSAPPRFRTISETQSFKQRAVVRVQCTLTCLWRSRSSQLTIQH